MSAISYLRESPSGPVVGGDLGQGALMVGPGTPGLVFRAQGNTGANAQSIAAPALVDGLSDLHWTLPTGYHYEVEAFGEVAGNAAAETYQLEVEVSSDAGATWTRVNNSYQVGMPIGGGIVRVAQMDVNRVSPIQYPNPVNRVRLRATGGTGSTIDAGNTTLKITQYVM